MLFLSPIVLSLSLYTAIVYGYLYLLFVTFDMVFQGQYKFSSKSVGLTYLGVGVGSIFGLVFCSMLSDRTVKALTKRNGGTSKPEYRLPPLIIGVFIIPLGLFLYGWSAEKQWHFMVPIVGSAFLGGGLFFCFMPIGSVFVLRTSFESLLTLL
jgi:predicted MFS family arabinose efflux permease